VKGKAKVIIASVLIMGAFSYLVLIGMKEGSMYYLEVGEFIDKADELGERKVRINGEVVNGSLDFNSQSLLFAFSLRDTKRSDVLNVIYKGTPPDLIEEKGVTLVAEGSYDKMKKIFVAKKLLVKCPSKYEREGLKT
jgi:cytochrome c-type biogenesis protein CcmE